MSYEDEKPKDKVEYNAEDLPTIRIILKSQETKNLTFVANKIAEIAKEKKMNVAGPKFLPNKNLAVTVRKSPCGEGTNTWSRMKMTIHTRIIDIRCDPSQVSEITKFKIKPGVDINIRIWNN